MEMQPAHPSGVIRRIRQACASCRQRKSKCSGERPVCAYCRQSRRSCVYEPYPITAAKHVDDAAVPSANSMPANHLLDRLSSIETTLSRLSQAEIQSSIRTQSPTTVEGSSPSIPSVPVCVNEAGPRGQLFNQTSASLSDNSTAPNFSLDRLPPPRVVRSLTETYFARAHNQPYSFFHRPSFWRQLEDGTLPRSLLFAVLSYAVRFSDNSYFHSKIHEASDAYSRQSWLYVLEDHLSVDNTHVLSLIQTVTLLCVIDYTAGRVSPGSLRLGLAIRLCQELDLQSEPPSYYSATEREERRRTFWSVYLVDKLMSCARTRPVVFVDDNCTLHLPSDEDTFEKGVRIQTPTLRQMLTWDTAQTNVPSFFSLTIITSSIFGQCTKFAHGRTGVDRPPPWHPASDFTATNSALLLLETHLKNSGKAPILDLVSCETLEDNFDDTDQINYLIFSHALFHLCHCLLNHPFIMRLRLSPIAARAPSSFALQAFQIAQRNAKQLTDLLIAASRGGVSLNSSFYTYCIAVAAGIHCLASGAQQHNISVDPYDARHYFQQSMDVLDRLAGHWPMVINMESKLRELEAQLETYASLFDINCLADSLISSSENFLWSILDYGALAEETPGSSTPMFLLSGLPSPSSWTLPVADHLDPTLAAVAPSNQLMFMTAGDNCFDGY